MGKIIDVQEVVDEKRAYLKAMVNSLADKFERKPAMKVILVGNHPASKSYVRGKKMAAEKIGIDIEIIRFPQEVTENELLDQIQVLNDDECVDGFLVQLPLPPHINEDNVNLSILPEKDIDGFHPSNIGKMVLGIPSFLPCTPKGIIEILKSQKVELSGKHVVVVGRSNIVGKPVALLALQENATITICHSRTKDLSAITKLADILIVAVGIPHFISAEDIKKDAVIIDVGVNRIEGSKKLVGDVNLEETLEKAALITPVPGGVGPMTITMLMQNLLESYCRNVGEVFE